MEEKTSNQLNVVILDNNWQDISLYQVLIRQVADKQGINNNISFYPKDEDEKNSMYDTLQGYFSSTPSSYIDDWNVLRKKIENANIVLIDYDFDTNRGYTGVIIWETIGTEEVEKTAFITGKGAKAFEPIRINIQNKGYYQVRSFGKLLCYLNGKLVIDYKHKEFSTFRGWLKDRMPQRKPNM